MIEIVRSPLLGEIPTASAVYANVGFLCVGSIVTLILFNRKCRRIAFWV
jgi:hypothetical protein